METDLLSSSASRTRLPVNNCCSRCLSSPIWSRTSLMFLSNLLAAETQPFFISIETRFSQQQHHVHIVVMLITTWPLGYYTILNGDLKSQLQLIFDCDFKSSDEKWSCKADRPITDGVNTDQNLDTGYGVSLLKVYKFCYLGDMLDADGGCDSAVMPKVRSTWKNSMNT